MTSTTWIIFSFLSLICITAALQISFTFLKRTHHSHFSTHLLSMDDSYHEINDNLIVPVGVTLKLALDMNAGVADASLERSDRFTCSDSLDLVHRLRKCSHVVLVGRGTVEQDNCTLTVRRVPPLKVIDKASDGNGAMKVVQPTRVVIDPSLRTVRENGVKHYALLQDGYDTIIYHSLSEKDFSRGNFQSLVPKNVLLVSVAAFDHPPIISPKDIVQDLQCRGYTHVMVEGGPATAQLFLRDRLVDRAILIHAPIHFKKPIPSGITHESLRVSGLVLMATRSCGVDTIEYWSKDGNPWPSAFDTWP